MLGACLPEEIPAAVRDGIMPTLSTLAEARAFSREARRQNKTVEVHLKVDTGMGRLGVRPEEAAQLARAISRLPGVRLTGLMTHFSSAEDDASFTRQQQQRFASVLNAIEAMGIVVPLVHACNSGGVLFEPDAHYNLVRPGLLVYGIIPPGKRKPPSSLARHLKPALQWRSRVTLVREVPKGAPISYGHTFITPRPMRLAVVGCGYGDGYMRAASQRASMLIGGRLCPVVGRVTMDQTLVDVSALPRVRAGDEVTLLGRQRSREISAAQLAEWFGTIPWEVLTNISYRVPRVYRGGQAA
jgi:alanine racemase